MTLPRRDGLTIDSLVVMMPQFAIHMDKSWHEVNVRSLTLQTTNAPVTIEVRVAYRLDQIWHGDSREI